MVSCSAPVIYADSEGHFTADFWAAYVEDCDKGYSYQGEGPTPAVMRAYALLRAEAVLNVAGR